MKKLKKVLRNLVLIILLPILFVNAVILMNSYAHPDKIPSFFGWKPFIVLSGSMETQIMTGDLVIVKECDASALKEKDIIAFKDKNIVITHRIERVVVEDGKVKYVTKGDNNNSEDQGYVLPEQVEGKFCFRIGRLGNLAMFIQTPMGMVISLSIPVLLLVLIQFMDSKKSKEEIITNANKQKEMEEELERLKKQNEDLRKRQ